MPIYKEDPTSIETIDSHKRCENIHCGWEKREHIEFNGKLYCPSFRDGKSVVEEWNVMVKRHKDVPDTIFAPNIEAIYDWLDDLAKSKNLGRVLIDGFTDEFHSFTFDHGDETKKKRPFVWAQFEGYKPVADVEITR